MLQFSLISAHIIFLHHFDAYYAFDITKRSSNITGRPHEAAEFCFSGQFLDLEQNECRSCPDGHYMPDLIHAQLRCYPCERVSDHSSEVVWAECTKTQPTTIGCKQGYFLRMAAVSDTDLTRCYSCTNCSQTTPPSFEIRSCGKSFDTVCCSRPDMTVAKRDGESGYGCRDPNSEKVSATQIPTRRTGLFRQRYPIDSMALSLSQVSDNYLVESKENSTLAHTFDTRDEATDNSCNGCSIFAWRIVGLSVASSAMLCTMVIFCQWKKKYVNGTSAKKHSLLGGGILALMKDSEKPLFRNLNSEPEKA